MALRALAVLCFFIITQSTGFLLRQGAIGAEKNDSILTTINNMKFEARDVATEMAAYHEKFLTKSATAYRQYKKRGFELLQQTIEENMSLMKNSTGINENDASVADCLGQARSNIDIQVTFLNGSDCEESDFSSFQNFSKTILSEIETGDRIIAELDKVVLRCCSPDRVRFERCATRNLSTPLEHLKGFRRRFKELRKNGRALRVKPDNFQCFGRRLLNVFTQKIPQIKLTGTDCIKKQSVHR